MTSDSVLDRVDDADPAKTLAESSGMGDEGGTGATCAFSAKEEVGSDDLKKESSKAPLFEGDAVAVVGSEVKKGEGEIVVVVVEEEEEEDDDMGGDLTLETKIEDRSVMDLDCDGGREASTSEKASGSADEVNEEGGKDSNVVEEQVQGASGVFVESEVGPGVIEVPEQKQGESRLGEDDMGKGLALEISEDAEPLVVREDMEIEEAAVMGRERDGDDHNPSTSEMECMETDQNGQEGGGTVLHSASVDGKKDSDGDDPVEEEQLQIASVVTTEFVQGEVADSRDGTHVVERVLAVELSVSSEGIGEGLPLEISQGAEHQVVSEGTETKDETVVNHDSDTDPKVSTSNMASVNSNQEGDVSKDSYLDDPLVAEQPHIEIVAPEVGAESNLSKDQEASILQVDSICDEANTGLGSVPVGVADNRVEKAEPHIKCTETEPETGGPAVLVGPQVMGEMCIESVVDSAQDRDAEASSMEVSLTTSNKNVGEGCNAKLNPLVVSSIAHQSDSVVEDSNAADIAIQSHSDMVGVEIEVRDGFMVDGSEGMVREAEMVSVDQATDPKASVTETTLLEANINPNTMEDDTILDQVPVDSMTDEAASVAKEPNPGDPVVEVHSQLTCEENVTGEKPVIDADLFIHDDRGTDPESFAPETTENVREEGDTILEPVSMDSTVHQDEVVAEDPNCADGETQLKDGSLMDCSEALGGEAETHIKSYVNDRETPLAETNQNVQGEGDTMCDPVVDSIANQQVDIAKDVNLADSVVELPPLRADVKTAKSEGSMLIVDEGTDYGNEATVSQNILAEEVNSTVPAVAVDESTEYQAALVEDLKLHRTFIEEEPQVSGKETEVGGGCLMDLDQVKVQEFSETKMPIMETIDNIQQKDNFQLDSVPVDVTLDQAIYKKDPLSVNPVEEPTLAMCTEIKEADGSFIPLIDHITKDSDSSDVAVEVHPKGIDREAEVGSGSMMDSDDGRNQLAELNLVIEENQPDSLTVDREESIGAELNEPIPIPIKVAEIGDGSIGSKDLDAGTCLAETISDFEVLPVSENDAIEGGQNADEGDVIMDGSIDSEQKVQLKETRTEIALLEKDQNVTYYLPLNESHFSISSLVWGKVKSHPWWPGQIFDPSDASKLAMKYQKKDSFLIAYYGDKTFAWCDESQLKPFCSHFSQLEKQCSSDAFAKAIHDILVELSRRVELGMACSCLPDEACANVKYQKVDNAGIRGGNISSVIDKHSIANYLQSDKLLQYIQTLAKFPNAKVDRLEFLIAQSQLKAFYRSKGYPELPVFSACGGLMEIDAESSPNNCKEPTPSSSDLVSIKGKLKIGDTSLDKREHGLKDVDKENTVHLANGGKRKSAAKSSEKLILSSSGKKHVESDHVDSGQGKKRMMGPFGDIEPRAPSPSITSSFKIGEFIRRAASQLTGAPPIVKSQSDTFQRKDDVMDFDVLPGSPVENPRAKLNFFVEDFDSPTDEMLTQLCLAACDPMTEYDFASSIVGFFTNFRNFYISGSSEDNEYVEKRKRGRPRKVLSEFQQASSDLSSSEEDEKHVEKRSKGIPKNVLSTDISSSEEVKHVEKRKRGRPRKVDTQPASSDHSSSEEKKPMQKRKRGRPKKVTSQPTSPNYSYLENKKHVEHIEHVEKPKRGRPRKVNSHIVSSEISPLDHMKDSYWSDVNNEKKRNGKRHKESQKKRMMLSASPIQQQIEQQMQLVAMNPNLKLTFTAERSIVSVEEKIVDECMPTALFLSFNNAKSLPSETDLIRIFSRYGPLKEAETDIMRKSNRAKVIFKRRVDAERAFSSAGKYSIFGPGLLSYQLKYLPSTPKSNPQATPQVIRDATSVAISKDNHDSSYSENHNAVPISMSVENHDVAPIDTLQINHDQSNPVTMAHDNHDPAVIIAVQDKFDAGLTAGSNSELLEQGEILIESCNEQTKEESKGTSEEDKNDPTPITTPHENPEAEPIAALSDEYEAALIESVNSEIPEQVEAGSTSDVMQVEEEGGSLQISEKAETGMASDFVQVEAEGVKIEVSDNIQFEAEGVNIEASGSIQVEGEGLNIVASDDFQFQAEGVNIEPVDSIHVEAEDVNIEASDNIHVEAESVDTKSSNMMQVEAEGVRIEVSDYIQVETDGVNREGSDMVRVEAEVFNREALDSVQVEAEGVNREAPDTVQVEAEGVNRECLDTIQVEGEGVTIETPSSIQIEAGGVNVESSDDNQVEAEGGSMEALDNIQVEAEDLNREGSDTVKVEVEGVNRQGSDTIQVEGEGVMEASGFIQVEAGGVNKYHSDDIQVEAEGVSMETLDTIQVEAEGVYTEASDSIQFEAECVDASDSMQVEAEGVHIEALDAMQVEFEGKESPE